MAINETTIHLKKESNVAEFESFASRIEGVQRAMVDIEKMNAVIQYDSHTLSKEALLTQFNKFI